MKQRRKKRPPIDVRQFSADSYIERAAAVRVIAERIDNAYGTEWEIRNRVSKRIGYALKLGKLSEAAPGVFVFGDLVTWARSVWEGEFDQLPTSPIVTTCTLDQTLPSKLCLGRVGVVSLPGDLAQCHEEIARLEKRVWELEDELEAARRDIDNLRPDADRWRAQRERLRISGRQRGRGRSK